ncbi:FtsX-like permease family protein [Chitinimonas arctica]|uniref:FtsX-like permease family protein n=1 Tax=Chitinimonas arctica TaxID=2594795 RepID=A0A516SK22_9NEIS|nr:ABC transporter permease [Chitinimonas arctica]QDQ28483.1 FtsX-like permease family protein [Chitinimonas arctica]
MSGPLRRMHRRLLPSLAWSGLLAQPGRSLACLLAILVGVALGYAIHLINHSAVSEFSQAATSLSGSADLSVRGALSDSLYARLAQDRDVAAASPVLEVRAQLPGQREPLLLLGVDALRVGAVAPQLLGQADMPAGDTGGGPAGLVLLEQDTVFLSPAAMASLRLAVGAKLTVQFGMQDLVLRVAGSLPAAGAGQRLGVMDIGAAQWKLGRLGELSRIDIKLRPGSNAGAFTQRWQAALPAGSRIDTAAGTEQRTADISRAYRVNLAVLGLVALFTGCFLVFSTQVLSLLRRRSQLALLRVLGLTRAELMGLILLEATALGVTGSGLGIVAGLGVAAGALHVLGGDLGSGFFNGISPQLHIEPWAMAGFFLLGLAATLIGSLIPAREAARAVPARALKAGDEESALDRIRSPWPGLALMMAAAPLLMLGPIGDLPLPGYLAIACLLIGALWLMPWLSARLLGAVPAAWRRGPVLGLALTQLKEAPGYAGIGLAGILASFSLMVAMVIMVASFRVSVVSWLDQLMPADLYLRAAAAGETAYLSPAEQARVAATAGIARYELMRLQGVILDPARPGVAVIARTMDRADAAAKLPLVGPNFAVPADRTPVWVSEAVVDLYGVRPGSPMLLPLQGKQVAVVVAGVWRDYARQHGSIMLALADYQRLTGDLRVNDVAMWLSEGSSSAALQQRLRAAVAHGERLDFAERSALRRISLAIFDRSFAVTYLLEAVAILVGLLGIGVSFGGQALARLREFGMLRHIGYRQTDIDRLLALEGALLAGIGVLAGLAVGFLISRILIDVINPQSFHWTMQTHIPWPVLGGVSLALIILAALTAVLAGRKALAVGAVRAVKEDW